jgi:hypothetical protein
MNNNNNNNNIGLSYDVEMNKNKLSPILRTISIGSSAAIFDSNSASHRKSFEATSFNNNNADTSNSTNNNNKLSNNTNESYRRSSIVYDKSITKRRVSQVKSEISGQQTHESFDCEH